jgi:hypothetical protein
LPEYGSVTPFDAEDAGGGQQRLLCEQGGSGTQIGRHSEIFEGVGGLEIARLVFECCTEVDFRGGNGLFAESGDDVLDGDDVGPEDAWPCLVGSRGRMWLEPEREVQLPLR